MKGRILIIKLGAIGDVIRTTPLIRVLRKTMPLRQIHWLTHTPEILPAEVSRAFRFTAEHIEILKSTEYELLINLDKDAEACCLAEKIRAGKKKGFGWTGSACRPLDRAARRKWLTGLFDDENRKNTKSYPREIFEMSGFEFNGEEYLLPRPDPGKWRIPKGRGVIGLNTGCGGRWSTRLWPETFWVKLARDLKKNGYTPLLLGGLQEDAKNKKIAQLSKARYLGHFDLKTFISLMNECDLVVTSVTMGLHIAIGLGKKVVLFNNIFNSREFELYGRGKILEPGLGCQNCFRSQCETPCMNRIKPDRVFESIRSLLS
ncbi:glycosyltransferase family 9 protein [bacterium]|nr:glycosyltransferase family 9 protein [bacterium]